MDGSGPDTAHAPFAGLAIGVDRLATARSTLRRAAVALGMRVEGLPAERDARRLAVWRAYVGAAVETASPLAARVCGLHGVVLDDLVSRFGPNRFWDRWLCGVRPQNAWLRSGPGGPGVRLPEEAEHANDVWPRGLAIRRVRRYCRRSIGERTRGSARWIRSRRGDCHDDL